MATIKDLKRLCKSFEDICDGCPLHNEIDNVCLMLTLERLPNNVDEIVDKWVEEHPVKTYAMDFFEKFPNAPKDRNGAPIACWKHVYGNGNDCGSGGCTECWTQEMKEE